MDQVSVIIPTYNRAETLPRAIESVLAQSFQGFKLWIVDDGSTDETQQKLEPYLLDPRISCLTSANRGVSHARNLAIEKSQAEWIAFLDSDDEWLPQKLQKQLALAEESQLKVIHTEEIWVRNGKRVNPKKKHQKRGGWILEHCLPLCVMSPSSILIHRSVFDEVGLFREDFPVCEDYELWLRICSQYEVGFLTEPLLIKYGGHADQLSHRYKAMDYWRVKALFDLWQGDGVDTVMKLEIKKEIQKKSKILLAGYKKYQSFPEHEKEIEELRERLIF